jgi:multiple sugar transport system permease protein
MAAPGKSVHLTAGAAYRPAAGGARLGRAAAHVLLTAVGLLMVFPFVWTIGTSLKTPGEIFTWPPALYPAQPQPLNYVDLFRTVPFFNWLRNSTVVTVGATLGAVLSSTLTGYAFACATRGGTCSSRSACRR